MSSDTGADIAVSARLSAQAARVAMELGRVADARRLASGATALAVSSCDDDATLDAVWAQHRCADPNTELPTVTRLGEQALELARWLRRPIDELFARLILLDASLVGGDLAGYDSGLIALTDLARSQDLVLGWWHVHRSRATRSALEGHFADARRHSAAAHRFAERLGDFSAQAMTGGFSLALAWLRWDPSEIDEGFLQDAVAFSFVPLIDVSLALAQVIQGRPDAARAAFGRHVASVTGYEADYSSLALYLYLGELACAFVDPSGATVVYQLFAPMAEQCGGTHSVFTIGAVALPLARLALTCGRHEQALAHLDVADRLNTRLAARPYLALGKLTRAMILAGRGHPGDLTEARAEVRGAAKEFRALDMPGRLRQAETLADELDAAARTNDPLSPREREVAELLADGMSNRAIANRLVLSERTVEQHVRSILAKLGLSSRTQVALWAARGR